jgi:hypothetical protein
MKLFLLFTSLPTRHLPDIRLRTTCSGCIRLAKEPLLSIFAGHRGFFLLNPLSGGEGKLQVCKPGDICSNPAGQPRFHPRIYGNQLIFLFSYSYIKPFITNKPAALSSIILWVYSSQSYYFPAYNTFIFMFNILLPAI